jgi:predicted nucleic acid-binding protein
MTSHSAQPPRDERPAGGTLVGWRASKNTRTLPYSRIQSLATQRVANWKHGLFPTDTSLGDAFALALKHQRAVYDCRYLALALREKCDLVTADDALVRQLQPVYGCLVALSSLP